MMLTLQRQLHDAVVRAIRQELAVDEVPPFSVEVPPNRALGDLAITVAFQLARGLGNPPRAIARQRGPRVEAIPGVVRVEAAPNGYRTVFLGRPAFLIAAVRNEIAPAAPAGSTGTIDKVVVE